MTFEQLPQTIEKMYAMMVAMQSKLDALNSQQQ